MQRRIPTRGLRRYVTQGTIEAVLRGAGVPLSQAWVAEQSQCSSVEHEEVEEEVAGKAEDA